MSGNLGEKARAAFLALIMVVSVVAMGAAFTGSATAQESASSNITIDEGDSITISGDTLESEGVINDQTNVSEYREVFDSNNNRNFDPVVDQGLVVDISSQENGNIAAGGYDNFYPYITVQFTESEGSDIDYAQLYYLGDGQTSVDSDYGSIYEEQAWQTMFFTEDGSPTDGPGDNVHPEIGMGLRDGIVSFVNSNENVQVESLSVGIISPNGAETVEDVVVGDKTIDLDEIGSSETSVEIGSDYYTSIQSAVDNAESGDTIEVGSGTYNESVTISTKSVTLEGPNAGDAGYSDSRGDEATITDKNGRLVIDAKNVTIDGFNFEFDESAIQSKSGEDNLITNNRFELTGATSDLYAVRVGGGSPGTDVTNNFFSDIVSDDGTGGDNADGIVVTDPRDTTVANNNFDTVDTGVNVGDKGPEAGTLVVQNNNFDNITQFGAVALANDDAGLDADINNNTIGSSSVGVGVYAGDSDSEIAVTDNNIIDVDNGVSASSVSVTVDATSNWWGATNGPSGDGYIGNGSSVSGDVNVNPASVDLDNGSIDLNQDFIGTVKDSQSVTLNGSSDASFSFNDSVSVPGDVNGTLTLEIAGEQYVFEDALENGKIAQDVDSGKSGTELSNTIPTGERNIGVNRYSDGNAVEDAGTVTLVHEVESLDEGFNLKSVPQPAQLYTQDVESTNQWNPSEGSYEGLEPNEGENIDSGTDLHRGLYVEAENDDARLGYSFSTDEVPTPDSVAMGNGWHLVGSNFDIDSESGSRTLDNDLRNVESVTTEGGPGVTAYDSELSGTIGGDTEINEYETYWVFVDDSQERIIVAPNYDPDER